MNTKVSLCLVLWESWREEVEKCLGKLQEDVIRNDTVLLSKREKELRLAQSCMSRSWRPQRSFTRTWNPARTSWKTREMELQRWVWSGCSVRLGSHNDSWFWKNMTKKTSFLYCFCFTSTYLKAWDFECMMWKSNYTNISEVVFGLCCCLCNTSCGCRKEKQLNDYAHPISCI